MKFKITFVLVSLVLLTACSPENEEYPVNNSSNLIIEIGGGTTPDPTSSSYQTDLMAGQHIYSGIVNVEVVDDNVVVSYTSENDWEIVETHLYVGDLNQLPTIAGTCPHRRVHGSSLDITRFQITTSTSGQRGGP